MFKKIFFIGLLSFPSVCFSTPLCKAIVRRNLDEVRRLVLLEGADVNAADGCLYGDTPLLLAAMSGQLAIVQFLQENSAKVNTPNQCRDTPLHLAAMRGHFGVVQFLLENGADVHAPGEHGDTPLHLAAMRGHFGVVQILLDQGANVHATNRHGKTPLDRASNQECIDLLNNHIEYLKNIGSRTKGALRESSAATSEGASSPAVLSNLQQSQQSFVGDEDDEEAEEPNHVPTTVAAQSPVAVEVTQTQAVTCTTTMSMATMPPDSLVIDFDALLDL